MAEHTTSLALNAGSVGLAPAQRQALAHIWAVLPHARLVGGVVRDLLAGRSVADVDIATPEPPEHVQAALEAVGIKVVPTGLAHGTVTAVIESAPYEITTLRQDTETDGRHAVVSWTQDWQQDAARRDFTINAMSRDKEGVLFDYFGGQADLQAGHVRFVGQAAQRIEEDALRILRFFRFQGRYGHGQPDVQAVTAIEKRTDLLKKLSVERVWSELQRLLVGPQAAQQVLLMARLGVLAAVFAQGVRVEHFAALVAVGAPPEPMLRLAGLIDGGAEACARNLKLSRVEESLLKALLTPVGLQPELSDAELSCLLSDNALPVLLGQSWLAQATALQVCPARQAESAQAFKQLRQRLVTLPVPVFPVAGKDLLAAGVPPGPQMGQILARLRQWWQQNGCTPTQEACLAQVPFLH